MKNALAEWQHKEMLLASNTGGHFAVIHLNDTVRQGGRGSARYFVAGYGFARCGLVRQGGHGTERRDKVWSGLAGQGLVRLGPFRQGGRGVARAGGVRQVEVWHGGRGPAWRGPV
jgi:hypothetical protein